MYRHTSAMRKRQLASQGIAPPSLTVGKVIARNPAQHTVDVATRNGSVIHGIPLMTPSAGTHFGFKSLPKTQPTPQAVTTALGPYDWPRDTLVADTWAVVAAVDDHPNAYVCLGFVFPESNELSIPTPGYELDRHESNITEIKSPTGDYELQFPDGTFVKIGATAVPTNFATGGGQNFDNTYHPWAVPTDGVARQVTIQTGTGAMVQIDAVGNVTVQPAAGKHVYIGGGAAGAAGAARFGDTVAVNVTVSGTDSRGDGFTASGSGTGTITSSSSIVELH